MTPAIDADILRRFEELLARAREAGDPEPTAMSLASVSADGRPSLRTVLLKAHDARGFVFYTNYRSRKGRELLAHPWAALLFHWKGIDHGVQVRIEGRVETVAHDEADAYFATRPRPSQIGAWASIQSDTLPSRDAFDQRFEQFEREYEGRGVPRPPHWSGFRLRPECIEFWYGAQFRLHERHVHEVVEGQWRQRMLYP